MTPDFRVLANSEDITTKLHDRLLSLHIIDEAGTRADRLELQLDDRDSAIAWPAQGAEIEVALGYKHSGITHMGLYIVDEIEHTAPPATLTIRAKATNMSAAIKAPTTKSWHDTTIGNLVKTIAAQHGLSAKISNTLANVAIPHLDQTEESNLHLLTRLARTYGAIAKPMGQSLIFVPRGEAKTATQTHLPIITINPSDIIQHRFLQTERSRYQAVCAHWHDITQAETQTVFVGKDKPVYVLRHPYATKEEAQHAAKAKLAALQRGTATLSLTLLGNPQLQAEGKINVLGLRKPIAGEWLIEQVKHQLNTEGFVTHLKTVPPKH